MHQHRLVFFLFTVSSNVVTRKSRHVSLSIQPTLNFSLPGVETLPAADALGLCRLSQSPSSTAAATDTIPQPRPLGSSSRQAN